MSHIMRRLRERQEGFTLVETLIVVMILGVVGAVFSSSIIGALRTEQRTSARADVQQALTVAMDRVTKQVRVASPLVAVSSTSVEVETYRHVGGADQKTGYVYVIDVAAGTVSETRKTYASVTALTPSTTATRVLARGVTAGQFTAHKRDGASTTTPTQVASIDISLTGTTPSGSSHTAKTKIFLRNFKG